MESFLNRYRNITVLLLVILAQLVLLAVQVKNDQDVRVIRVWTITAVTPAARVVEWLRGGSIGFVRNYIMLHQADAENRRLREENGKLKLENIFLKNEISTADRAKALQLFQSHTPSRTLAANVIGIGAGSNANVVFVNRGSVEGVMRGMAVVTPEGIVGKIIASYPTASEVLLVTDPDFAAGAISQTNLVRGTLKGQGRPVCKLDYVPVEEKVQTGDWFYTSGDDRIFPRGFPIGTVKSVRQAQPFQEILIEPSGLRHGLEDVLILIQGVHQDIPETPPVHQPVYIAPPPPAPGQTEGVPQAGGTEADKLRSIYKSVGDAQNHVFGTGAPGSKPPDFTKLPSSPLPAGAAAQPATPQKAPSNPVPGQPQPARPSAQPNTTQQGQSPATRPAAPPVSQPSDRAPAPAGSPVKNPPASVPPGDPARRGNPAAGAPGGPGR